MINVQIDLKYLKDFLSESQLQQYGKQIPDVYRMIYDKTGAGNDFLGWVDLPSQTNESLLEDIIACAKTIRQKAELFVVIGIGGSYLGARAVIESLSTYFSHYENQTRVIYAGQNISEDYLADLLDLLDKKEYALAVISKSGTTTEPAIAFRILKAHLEQKYGIAEARKRIVAITDKSKGALKQLADAENYKTYVVPDDVGGRYSVLTPVGLLPIAVAGIDIKQLVFGAQKMEAFSRANQQMEANPIAQYAVVRQALYHSGKTTEIMVNYEPRLFYFSEWWKQLYGESEGKEQKGIFPASVGFTTDLHSMGQYIQEGLRMLFETVISIEKSNRELRIPHAENDLDQLNYIAGHRLSEVNRTAEMGTVFAHIDGGVPNIRIQLPELTPDSVGQLIYFFEMGCALSGYMLNVNPFDQPGVEAYKNNMFALLGKKGYEELMRILKTQMETNK
ncbi:MAG: glucose-6-phosphate isomerase [Lentimicrobiaceae bacterium]|nr:glucose-6-phosphate isomerase [Lentimicrobiaceae bacterium]